MHKLFNWPAKWSLALLCLAFAAAALMADDGTDAVESYRTKLAGFQLRKRVVGEISRSENGVFSTRIEWAWDQEQNALGPPKAKRTAISAEAERRRMAERGLQETWRRETDEGKCNVRLRKVICSDEEMLARSMKFLFDRYSIRPVELEKPVLGDRTWISEASSSYVIVCSSQLSWVRVYVSSKSLSSEQRRELAKGLAGDLLKLARDAWPQVPPESLRTGDSSKPPPSVSMPISQALSHAIEQNDIGVLSGYTEGSKRDDARIAAAALAKTAEGRAALAEILNDTATDRSHARTILVALGNAEAPDAVQQLRRFAESTEDSKLFDEAMEGTLKAMSESEARQYCIEQAEELADNPDTSPEKLLFLMRGLGQDEDPPEVKVLRKILQRTKRDDLTDMCMRILAQRIPDGAECREDVLRLCRQRAGDPKMKVRGYCAGAFGASGDVRYIPRLAAMLDDPDRHVQETAAKGICQLLGWERPRVDWAKETVRQEALIKLKARLEPILKALAELDAAINKPVL